MILNAAVAKNFSEVLVELGGIPTERVRHEPKPGLASLEDVVRVNEGGGKYELVDGTLVEKAMGWRESLIACVLVDVIRQFLRNNDLGLVSGPDGFMQILRSQVRGPDVAFISWNRLPGGAVPQDPIPAMVPDLAIEVLSIGNTFAEMARKRREYFHAGVRQVWMVDLNERTVAVFTDITQYELFDEDATLGGGDVLPGLEISLSQVFSELDRKRP